MSSGMNLEQAIEYAKTMTYSEAVSNVKYGKFIKYRKATRIKLRELAEIADKLDQQNYALVAMEALHSLGAERKRGEWITHYETYEDSGETVPYGVKCPFCGRWEENKEPFCNCGADMRGAE